MIKLNVDESIVSVCESTANCSINLKQYHIDSIVEFLEKNNYICQVVYNDDIEHAKKLAYYSGGLPTDDPVVLEDIEASFE